MNVATVCSALVDQKYRNIENNTVRACVCVREFAMPVQPVINEA